ncbi:unnamed protein product [Rhodiola kirilowii]
MQSLQMTIQGSKNNSSLETDTSKDEKNDRNSGISGDGLIVCWNKFLPFRSLRVLVVESDDSTRQVVGALLKKCGYEVIAVANGLQAWKVLEDRNNHVDIVLTEVVLPFLTGLGLLRKIMNHETRKNLPVIMMSPSDSLGVVFKCLSKGATDFLVKPIRKNELRTLWQHVWRKCHSSSGGSAAESDAVTRSKAPVNSSGLGKSGSNNGDDNGSHGLNNRSGLSERNGSDQGSGTQAPKDNRKSKPDPPPASSSGRLSDPPLHNWDLNHSAGELEGHNIGDKTMGRVIARVPGNMSSKLKTTPIEKVPETKATSYDKAVQEYTSKDNRPSEKELFEFNEQPSLKELAKGDAYLTTASTNNIHPREKVADAGECNGLRNVNHHNSSDVCFLELVPKQSETKGNGGKAVRQRNVLGHSGHSAFSRYGSASIANKVQRGNEGSCSPYEGGTEAATEEPLPKYPGYSSGITTDYNSEDNRRAYDNGAVIEPQGCKDKQPINSNTKSCLHPNSVQLVKRTHTHGESGSKANASSGDTTVAHPEHIQLQHHFHPYHHHHYHAQNMQQPMKGFDHGDTAMNDVPIMNGPPSLLQAPFSGSVIHNLNSRSPPGQNSWSAAANTFGVNPMADTGIVYGFMNGITANRQLQRLAAIHKFRQKRKERCFGKKVRCESRKILAEQRPRMKGQFVRRADISDNAGVHFL